MKLFLEKYSPFLWGALSATFVYWLSPFPVSGAITAGTMAMGVVVAGFTATQRNMIIGMKGTKLLRFEAASGEGEYVCYYLHQCIRMALLLSVISALYFFADGLSVQFQHDTQHQYREFLETLWTMAWFFFLAATFASLWRNERMMGSAIVQFIREQGPSKPKAYDPEKIKKMQREESEKRKMSRRSENTET